MKRDIADKWIQALLSGKYKQGTNYLRTVDNRFCCLGVLCELAIQEGIIPQAKLNHYYNNDVGYTYQDNYKSVLPDEVMKWAGMKNYNGEISDSQTLSSDNDNGDDFKTIAQTIRNNVDIL